MKRVTALVLFALFVCSAAQAAETTADNVWRRALAFSATVREGGEFPADVYISQDHKSLLLHPAEGAHAFVLRLQSSDVVQLPEAAVKLEEEGASLAPGAEEKIIGRFSKEGASIRFASPGASLFVGPMADLIGEVSLSEIAARRPALRRMADAYTPDKDAVATIHAFDKPAEIVVFFGTWCPVCAKRLPLFVKTMEAAANPAIRVRYIGIDSDYTKPADLIRDYRVHITPTFIVLAGGREAGRIQEAPHPSLEQALAAIFEKAR